MSNPADLYHQRAVECLRMADEMTDPRKREVMQELALSWLSVSERAEEYWRRQASTRPFIAT
jgi:hypothetical protein